MSESKWSKYVRGLECFNGIALFHHLITKKILIGSNKLFGFIESNNISELPIDIKEELEQHSFIVKYKVEDDEILNKKTKDIIELANHGKLIKYYNITDNINKKETFNKLCKEIIRVNTNFNGFVIIDFYNSVLNDIKPYIGKIKFVISVDLNKIDKNFKEKLNGFRYKNIGVKFYLSEIKSDVFNLLNELNINDYTYVIDLNFQSIEQLKKYEEFICLYSINLKYNGTISNHKALIDLYNYVEQLKLKNKFINANWEIPLKHIQNEIEDNYYSININSVKDVKKVFSNECIKLLNFNSKGKISCENCGIEALCMYKFVNYNEDNKNPLCFLSKYSIAKYIDNNFRSGLNE